MSQPLPEIAQSLLAAATRAGADAADAVALSGTSLTIGLQGRQLEEANRAEASDFGLRVFVGQRQACVSGADAAPDALTAMAERAVAMAREAPEDPYAGLADPDQLSDRRDGAGLDLEDTSPEPDPAALEAAAREAETAALDTPGIAQVESAAAAYGRRAVALAATNGFAGAYERTDFSLYCMAITGEGSEMERDGYGDSRSHGADLIAPAEIGARAAARALERKGARKPPTGQFPVLYDERIAGSLIAHLLAAANGAAIARGSSWLRDGLETQILPESMSLIEEPHRPRAAGSRPFDGEGLPTAERAIIQEGRLTGWTLDLATARKLGLRSTGNAARGPSAPPQPSNWNMRLTQGSASRADLMAQMGTGLLVTSMIGASINPTTGDYSRGAAGVWIENGAPAYPVNECTIAGNLHDMLRGLVPGNDARPHLSRVVPSLLVEGLTIAGQ